MLLKQLLIHVVLSVQLEKLCLHCFEDLFSLHDGIMEGCIIKVQLLQLALQRQGRIRDSLGTLQRSR